MEQLTAWELLKENTHMESGCWVANTKARSTRFNGKILTLSELAKLASGRKYKDASFRPFRKCGNKWCYNPDHLFFESMERMYLYTKINETTGCWEWQKSKDGGGYGVFFCSKYGKDKAHRISYRENIGEIPDGLFVCHSCDNPSCINPAHLFLGTNQDNINDKVSKNRQTRLKGSTNGRSLLCEEEVINMRQDYSSGEYSYRDLVRKYNISQTQVARILKKESWAWA